jgi:thiol-disulfide isomerase/thioredoxin
MSPGNMFLDAKSMENFDFLDRNMINIDLALGFLSDENRLTRQQLIMQAQQGFAAVMMQLDPSVPEMFVKARRPFEDTLYALGVKHCDSYLPTLEEAAKIAQAKAQQGPGAAEQEIQSKTELNKAKTQESQTVSALNVKKAEDIDMDNFFEMKAMKAGKLSAVEID